MRDGAQNGHMTENRPERNVDGHSADCTRPGFRYGLTVKRTKTTVENGTAGKVLMFCKNGRCPARRYV